jgi:replication factor A1
MTNQVYKLKEIKAGMRAIDVESAIVMEVKEKRQVSLKSGGFNNVQELLLGDDTGEIKFSLWGNDVGKFAVGDRLDITNAYVNTFKGANSLSTGKFGKVVKAI